MKTINLMTTGLILLAVVLVMLPTAVRADGGGTDNLANLNLKPVMVEGRTMFSLRQLAGVYDFVLTYLPLDRSVLISRGEEEVRLDLNQGLLDGQQLSQSPVLIKGRTYLDIDALTMIIRRLMGEQGPELLTTLAVDRDGEQVSALIRIYNIARRTVNLKFNSGQSYDLSLRQDGEEVWHWSEGRFFTMALVTRKLAPGEQLSYRAELPEEELQPGSYLLTGKITTHPELSLAGTTITVSP